MFQKILHFIKYNNLTVLLVLAVFVIGGGVFAATPTGQEAIGIQEKKVEGVDNTLLLAADLDKIDMNFKIEKIDEDAKYYYVTYTFLDLVKGDGAWQYQVQEKVKKISKKLREDLGLFLARKFQDEYQSKIKDLKAEKEKAQAVGSVTRTEVVAYTGLIGQTLDIVGKVFPGYEPVKKYEIPSPTVPPEILQMTDNITNSTEIDNLAKIYQDYITNNNLNSTTTIDTVQATSTNDMSNSSSTDAISDSVETPINSDQAIPSDSSTPSDATNVEVIELPTE